jgi:hypothetical protein
MSRHVTTMTIDDAEHYSAEQRAQIVASYPEHQREARSRGIPTMGSGRVFPVAESLIVVEPMPIPKHWPQIIGLDFGWDHPTAAARLAWDRDRDCIYVTACHRLSEAVPAIHAASISAWGRWMPVAWPHDGLQHDKGSGQQLKEQYASHGLAMLPEQASHPEGGNGVEAGLIDMLERMQTGRLKVFSVCLDWLEEFRLYHRDNGKVIKVRDDVLSATRYGIMMMRHAIIEPRIEREQRRARIGHLS